MSATAAGRRVLLVEDEPGLVLTLTDRLKSEGYDVGVGRDAPTGLRLGTQESWDVMLLDVMLPGGSGFDLVRAIRDRGVTSPVIMLTARGQIVDKVLGLKLGADDYLTKPFSMVELLARVRVALRHLGPPSASTLHTFGELSIDFSRRTVTMQGRDVKLSPTEWELLKVLVSEPNRVLTYKSLLRQVWGPAYGEEEHYLHVYVAGLRKKIEVNPRQPKLIHTEPGVGYRFRSEG